MRLNRIEIENFKGIGKRQSIDLKPITLLFGPNSAGKSTVLQALHYVREILERQNPDPDQTIAGGLIDLGGFKALVHNLELLRAIYIKLVIDLSEEQGSERLPINSGTALDDARFANLGIRYIVGENTDLKDYAVVQEIGVGIEVRWSDLLSGPYLSSLDIEMDGEPIASIKSPPQEGRATLSDFNFNHPFLQAVVDQDDLPEEKEVEALSTDVAPGAQETDPFVSPLASEIWELSRALASPEAKEDHVAELRTVGDAQRTNFPIGIKTITGGLPDIAKAIELDLTDIDKKAIQERYQQGGSISRLTKETAQKVADEIQIETDRRDVLSLLLDEMILGPLRIVRDYLNVMTYIGPLREIPTRGFRPRLSPDESRWAHGLAAWDALYTDRKSELMDEVNCWLSDERHLNTGYRLERVIFKEIPVPSLFHQMFERGLSEDDIGELQELYDSLQSRTEIGLRDFEKGILVSPSDVGVGISQMVPVVVGALREQDGLLAIEQPELHVHPAIQVGIGDLFIRAVKSDSDQPFGNKTLLIETHSEHIMLRLLRRIREKTEGELPPQVLGLDPEDLSVIYVEGSEEGVRFQPLTVDKDGEFLDHWPHGFFEERAEELF